MYVIIDMVHAIALMGQHYFGGIHWVIYHIGNMQKGTEKMGML